MPRVAPLAAAVAAAAALVRAAPPSFQVSGNQFLLDGAPLTIKSGSMHYHRTHPSLWKDRLTRLAAMGLNTIQTYVPWNVHALPGQPDEFDWGQINPANNLSAFISTAAEVGLFVNVRPGPFICGEHEMGGLPWAMFNAPGLQFRTNNTAYLGFVEPYWRSVLGQLKPHIRANGGNVLMVSVENE